MRLLGQIEATGQMIAQIPAKKRNIGAPVLDAQDQVIGVVAGPLTLHGATDAQAKGLRKLAAVVGITGLPAFLDAHQITYQRAAAGPDAPPNVQTAQTGTAGRFGHIQPAKAQLAHLRPQLFGNGALGLPVAGVGCDVVLAKGIGHVENS